MRPLVIYFDMWRAECAVMTRIQVDLDSFGVTSELRSILRTLLRARTGRSTRTAFAIDWTGMCAASSSVFEVALLDVDAFARESATE
eukprot:275097-Rhodomonas_salina.1